MVTSLDRTPSASAYVVTVPGAFAMKVGLKPVVDELKLMMLMSLKLHSGVCLTWVGLLFASFGVTSRWTRQPTWASEAPPDPGTSAPPHSTKYTLAPSLATGAVLSGMSGGIPPPSLLGGGVGLGFDGFGFVGLGV